MNLQPLEDRIVVRPAEAEETTVSGLVIPDTAKEKPQQGEVLAVGPGRRAENSGELIAMDLAVGDTVVYSKYGGTEITVDGEDVLILSSATCSPRSLAARRSNEAPTGSGAMTELDEQGARGGRQLIPRPPISSPGAPSPWARARPRPSGRSPLADVREPRSRAPGPGRTRRCGASDPTGARPSSAVAMRRSAVLIAVVRGGRRGACGAHPPSPSTSPRTRARSRSPAARSSRGVDRRRRDAAALREAEEEIGLSPSRRSR